MEWGAEAERRLTEIAACSETTDGVTRLPFTPEHAAANVLIRRWMEQAGLSVHLDAAGTLVGRKAGPEGAPTLLIGSHQDSVRNGGRYDGIMGVVLACLALERLQAEGVALPFGTEVLAFADEEGVRFPTALMGPRALAGTLDPEIFDLTDRAGNRLGAALEAFGGDAEAALTLARDPTRTWGFLEVHIEQGPVLEEENLALGVVTGICGIERNRVRFTGETGHAGTVPMQGRRDALVAASRFVARVHDAACAQPDLRATVGTQEVHPDVVNAIPESVDLTLEVRAPDDADRARFADTARAEGEGLAAAAGLTFEMDRTYAQPAVPCDAPLRGALAKAVTARAGSARLLPSGATHDTSAMADLCPVAMLFLRCRDGASHSPREFASAADMGLAVEVLAEALTGMSRHPV
jgi:allantoate deiminase